jgi:hypothetical protein
MTAMTAFLFYQLQRIFRESGIRNAVTAVIPVMVKQPLENEAVANFRSSGGQFAMIT